MSSRLTCIAAALVGLTSGAPVDVDMLRKLENMPGETLDAKLAYMAHDLRAHGSARGVRLAEGARA